MQFCVGTPRFLARFHARLFEVALVAERLEKTFFVKNLLHALEAAFDLDGAFSNVVIKLAPGTSEDRVIEEVDRLIAPYGGIGASGRADQISHAFLDAELKQLSAMVKVLPPIFLLVAAILVTLLVFSRIVDLRRIFGAGA